MVFRIEIKKNFVQEIKDYCNRINYLFICFEIGLNHIQFSEEFIKKKNK